MEAVDVEVVVGDAEEARNRLHGSTVAIVGAGYSGKRFIYERAAELGVRLVILDEAGSWAERLVDDGAAVAFLPIDPLARVAPQSAAALEQLEAFGPVDAVCTFWENSVPVAARVADALGLPGNPPAAVDLARSKRLTRRCAESAGLPTPTCVPIRGRADLADAAEAVGFPAVLKPEFGAAAMGCIRVDDVPALERAYEDVQPIVSVATDSIFSYGTDLVLEEYLDGTEFDVDLVLSDGDCVFSSVSQNWPTHEPHLGETGLHLPGTAPLHEQAELVELAVATATALGLSTGVLHVEAKYTSRGPRVVEVNARMGGTIVRDAIQLVHGVDLVDQHLLASVGVRLAPRADQPARCAVANAVLYADCSGIAEPLPFLDALHDDPRVFYARIDVEPGDPVVGPADGFPSLLCEIALAESDVSAAVCAIRELTGASVPMIDVR